MLVTDDVVGGENRTLAVGCDEGVFVVSGVSKLKNDVDAGGESSLEKMLVWGVGFLLFSVGCEGAASFLLRCSMPFTLDWLVS